MPRKPQDVTDAELAILQVLWDRGQATVRQLTEVLYPAEEGAQFATVQKLLGRLEGKGCVERNRDAWPHVFYATIAREELIGRQLQNTAERLCEGSLAPLLSHLVKNRELSNEERDMLRGLLDELEGEPQAKSK
jgi:BlaI family transcriptional regulator, penicillinase repressor